METVNIKLDLTIITHDAVKEHPHIVVKVNDTPYFDEICSKDLVISFDMEVEDDNEYALDVLYDNKNFRTDVILDENGSILADKRIVINAMSLDDIELNPYVLTEDALIYESTDSVEFNNKGRAAANLSWNGRTTFKFTAPVYMWLLENL